ncbi:hypothetical protein CFAL_11250 [Corynebacterium falsenii DSM 44353]|uniref:Uncharacterized protein n=3 Tax=Micrococcales TaxID=85006 RepID=A0A7T4MTB7_9MICC|nr:MULTISPECIES: hypothetical protein [Actinomycetes]AHI04081.1 hypothetical protein CFAL_11250 [Corynebacterium falsenii DSM 44353]QQC59231.1 hypothetical protein I6H58_09880 [Rothia kristinae]ROZ61467.1 hypothetical protein EDL96_13325 [Kocuria soli]UBI04864.1 hypothetical protein LA343_01390 [Corynebacterium falsenii]
MTLTATVFVIILAAALPLAIFVVLTVWVVRTVTSARRETATAIDGSNQLIVEHLRNITERLDRIEAQLSEVPE